MRVLVTGAGGLLGGALVRAGAIGRTREELDVTDADAVARALDALRPDAVVNAAARAGVDAAEREPGAAWAVNARAPGELARLCAERGVFLVHVSTDYVLRGPDRPGHRLSEDEPPRPVGVYAESKLAGERAALAAGAAVVRVQWLHDPFRPCFLHRALGALGRGERLRLVVDQVGSPTPVALLAPLLLRCAAARRTGLWHLACAGETTPWVWVERAAALLGLPFRAEPVRRADLGGVPRPARSCLDSSRFARDFGAALPPWDEALERVVRAGPATATRSPRR